ncbi:hypothetical protein EV714DRAFT_243168 [Schizophyllum commune]
MADSPPASAAVAFDELVSPLLSPLRSEFERLSGLVSSRDEEIRTLQNELALYKNAYESTSARQVAAEKERDDAVRLAEAIRKELEDSQAVADGLLQAKGHRIVVLVDGDGAIFDDDLIVRGQDGGHNAAQRLRLSIASHLKETQGDVAYQIWVYVFFNKRGLSETFNNIGLIGFKEFDDFVLGFNKSSERFIMVDVGNTKEAADAKLRALLEDEARMPSTARVYFAGCHDNGYAHTLRSLITDGYRDKLVLLRGYSDMAKEIGMLGLPDFTIPDLFRASKIESIWRSPQPAQQSFFPPATIPASGFPEYYAYNYGAGADNVPLPSSPAVFSGRPDLVEGGLATFPNVPQTPSSSNTSPTPSKALKLNPRKPFWTNDPPPCRTFILQKQCLLKKCKYSHDYVVSPEDEARIREETQRMACEHAVKGKQCPWGKRCIYGHTCPDGPACVKHKNGKCKFRGADMHK